MFRLFKSRSGQTKPNKTWAGPHYWIEPERRPLTTRAGIERDRLDKRRWMRDVGIL